MQTIEPHKLHAVNGGAKTASTNPDVRAQSDALLKNLQSTLQTLRNTDSQPR